jgi:hypothetical protein
VQISRIASKSRLSSVSVPSSSDCIRALKLTTSVNTMAASDRWPRLRGLFVPRGLFVSGTMRARQAAFFPGPAQCLCGRPAPGRGLPAAFNRIFATAGLN